MRNSVKSALKETLQGFLDAGMDVDFSEKELKSLGIDFKEVNLTANKIRNIRKKAALSQSVFAKLLNVSLSSVRQWEQGKRTPTGATQVLLELLEREPHALDFRIKA